MIPYTTKEIETYVGSLEEGQKELVLAMRKAVLTASPKVKEGIKWGSIAFFHKKNICGYRVAKKHITLLFMEGASLKDVHGILEGDGAKARTYKVALGGTINAEAIGNLVNQCLEKGM